MTAIQRLAIGGIAVAVFDLGTKFAASAAASGRTTGIVVPLRNDALSLEVASLPRGTSVALAAGALLVVGALVARATRSGVLRPWVGACLLGGAAANLVDRAVFGAVHDFLAIGNVVLNVGDVAIVAGLVGLYTRMWSRRRGDTLGAATSS